MFRFHLLQEHLVVDVYIYCSNWPSIWRDTSLSLQLYHLHSTLTWSEYPPIRVQSLLLFRWQQIFHIYEASLHKLFLRRRNNLRWDIANQRCYDWLEFQLDQTQKSFQVLHKHWMIQRVSVLDSTTVYYILIQKICKTLRDSL